MLDWGGGSWVGDGGGGRTKFDDVGRGGLDTRDVEGSLTPMSVGMRCARCAQASHLYIAIGDSRYTTPGSSKRF